MYNPKYIVNGQMWQYRGPKGPAIHTFFTADGTAIGMFQGSRGVRPDLDFKVKYYCQILNQCHIYFRMMNGLWIY